MAQVQQSSKAKVHIVFNYGKDPVEVFGDIYGERYTNDRIEFFYRTSGQGVVLTPGKDIPLNTSEVNIPNYVDHLLINARLWHGSKQIVAGGYSFGIGKPGQSVKHTIGGGNYPGSIDVNIRWE